MWFFREKLLRKSSENSLWIYEIQENWEDYTWKNEGDARWWIWNDFSAEIDNSFETSFWVIENQTKSFPEKLRESSETREDAYENS